jgi:alpha-L-fucosidase
VGSARPGAASRRSLRRRRVPAWWLDAKLGIFIHWTPASVPGFAPTDVEVTELLATGVPDPVAHTPYTEWYENSLRFPDSPVARWHREHFGERTYASFADDFRDALERWDPGDWAERFARAGAAYVVLVAKHHDGFCLWPSDVTNPHRPGWHTGRDVVGELADAVRARGLRFGVYYSGGLDWTFDDRPLGRPADVFASAPGSAEYRDYAEAQVRELMDRYRPSVVWNDICWPFGGARLRRLFADYYAAVPDGVVNDRWLPRTPVWSLLERGPVAAGFDALARRVGPGGAPPKPAHFDVRTPEYATFDHVPADAWECCRGIDRSFGYNRASPQEHFLSRDDLLGGLADIVAHGGNLLLNVGPRGEDASIPGDQQLRLDWLGEWLAAAGPALRGTRPWVRQHGLSPEGHRLRYSARGDAVHVLVLDGPDGAVTLTDVVPRPTGGVRLADGTSLPWRPVPGGGVRVDLTAVPAHVPRPLALTVDAAEARPLTLIGGPA